MKWKTKKLTWKEIELLKENFESLKFFYEFDVVYESQVPPAGFLVLEGEIKLMKKTKVQGSILPGSIIGVYQLIHNHPMKVGMKISSNSELLVLHKSEILDALTNKASELFPLIRSILK